jgi:hypothetical protein
MCPGTHPSLQLVIEAKDGGQIGGFRAQVVTKAD